MEIINHQQSITREGVDKHYFNIKVTDKTLKVDKLKDMINSGDYIDDKGVLDKELFFEDAFNERTYTCSIILNGSMVTHCSCKHGTIEISRKIKTNKHCRHLQLAIDTLKEKGII